MRFALIAALATTVLAADTPHLAYEGISAATTLADLKARFSAEQINMGSEPDPANPKQPVTASVRFEPWLGRSYFMDYYDREGEERVIRLFFVEPGTKHPGNEVPLACNVLLDELRARHGKEEKTDDYNEEAMEHVRYIWTHANETMTLDCGAVAPEPVTVDRLYFVCKGTCRR